MTTITPVILAGGSGTRLWPLSRKSFPKQFSNFIGKETLFQQSVLRLSSSDQMLFSKHITVTNCNFRFIVAEQLQNIGIDPGPILIEPESKNTAPAILAAAIFAMTNNKDAILLVSPSDHVITDIKNFHNALSLGVKEALNGKIVAFGISPSRAETGYGYLSLSKKIQKYPLKVKKFIEKPDLISAKSMLNAGTYLWNAGIFMFRAKDLIRAFEDFAPAFVNPVTQSVVHGISDLGFFRLEPKAWSECKNLSIDYAIMEHSSNLVAVPLFSKWTDLGGWDAVWEGMKADRDGVVVSKNAYSIDSKNTLLRSESPDQVLVGLGLENIVAVAMGDAVLVAHKDKAQNVKQIVSKLKSKKIKQAEILPKDHRPWGWFEIIGKGDNFQVKHILINPGAAISLQSHHYRSEHWIVVKGIAKVTLNEEIKLVAQGESVFVPVGSIHRMENPGTMPIIIIEIQTGSYLGEDDIVRYEDLYSR